MLAIGLVFFVEAELGLHPYHGVCYAIQDYFYIPFLSYANISIIVNLLLIVPQLLFGRRYISIGTVINMFLLGYVVTFFTWLFLRLGLTPQHLPARIVSVMLGTLLISLGIAFYQTADAGIAPYDCIPIYLADRTKLPFVLGRIALDASFAIICLLFGGFHYISIGTLALVFCTGPFIHFFQTVCTDQWMRVLAKA